ncbi:uncharacterized protein [Coffea arabica]|uniref:RNase H type-1 domain-containing protein n=1 Tax=Coffea arabica TaxID=13443 RepID=A0ABM4W1P7_COFAR
MQHTWKPKRIIQCEVSRPPNSDMKNKESGVWGSERKCNIETTRLKKKLVEPSWERSTAEICDNDLETRSNQLGWINRLASLLLEMKARNKIIFDNAKVEEIIVVRKAQQKWIEFKEAVELKDRAGIVEVTPNQHDRRWKPPIEDVYKINIDAAISAPMIRTGKGIVARNWKGEIMKIWAIMEEKIGEPELEEATAIKAAMQLGKEAGWRKIEIQSDCKSVIDCILTVLCNNCNYAVILEDIQKLRDFFNQCNFSFI